MFEVARALEIKREQYGAPKRFTEKDITRTVFADPVYIDESDGVWNVSDKEPPTGRSKTFVKTLEVVDDMLKGLRDDEEVGSISARFVTTGNKTNGIRHVTADIYAVLIRKREETK